MPILCLAYTVKEPMNKRRHQRVPLLLFLAFLILPICGQAYESNIVMDFRVEGNRMIEDEVILLNLKIKKGDPFDQEAIQAEIARLGEMGYFSYVGAEVISEGKGKVLIFKVEENAIMGEVNIRGCTKVKDEKIKTALESRVGTVFNSKLLTQDIQNVNELLAQEGYLFSKVTDAYVQEKGSRIFIEITEGMLTEIKVEGLKKTKEYVVRRELTAKTGEIYDNKKIVRDLQRVYNLGFFEEVKRDHLPGKNPEDVVLVIQVVEQKTGRAGVGGG